MPEACHSLATNYIFSALGHKITRFSIWVTRFSTEVQGFLQRYKVFYRGTRFSTEVQGFLWRIDTPMWPIRSQHLLQLGSKRWFSYMYLAHIPSMPPCCLSWDWIQRCQWSSDLHAIHSWLVTLPVLLMEQPIILGRIIYQHTVGCSLKSTCWATKPNLTAILFAAVWLLNYMCNVVWSSLLPSWLCRLSSHNMTYIQR